MGLHYHWWWWGCKNYREDDDVVEDKKGDNSSVQVNDNVGGDEMEAAETENTKEFQAIQYNQYLYPQDGEQKRVK